MNGSSFGGILQDISVGGLCVDVVGPKPAGNRVLVDFDIAETGEHFEGAGKIIWQSELSSRLGIQFIDLPQSSHLKIQSWLSGRSSSRGRVGDPAPPGGDVVFVESSTWLRERSFGAGTSDAAERQLSVRAEAASNREQPQEAPLPPITPVASTAVVLPSQDHDSDARDLRSSFSRMLAAEPPATQIAREAVARDWKRIGQWLLTACVLLMAIAILAVAIKLSTTNNFDIGEAYQHLKTLASQNLARLVTPETSAPAAGPVPASVNSPLNKPSRPRGVQVGPADPPLDVLAKQVPTNKDKFEILDAQHGRRYFPRTSTNLIVQFEKSGLPLESMPEGAKTVAEPVSSNTIYISRANVGAYETAPITGTTAKLGRILSHSTGELPVTETMPDYPAFALQKNVQGRVILTAIISRGGNLEDVRILSTPSVLDATVLEAVKTWRYQPHLENGKPVEAVTEIVVDFSITKN